MTDIDNSIVNSSDAIGVSYALNVDQSVGADAVIKYDTKLYDSDNSYSTATGIFTVKHAGLYQVNVGVCIDELTAGGSAYLVINGAPKLAFICEISDQNTTRSGCIAVPFSVGDQVQIFTDTAAHYTGFVNPGYANYMSIIRQ